MRQYFGNELCNRPLESFDFRFQRVDTLLQFSVGGAPRFEHAFDLESNAQLLWFAPSNTRAGDEALRAVLVSGATAVIRHAVRCGGRASPWLLDLLKRKPPKLAAVALANKMARIAWKLMVTGGSYAAIPPPPPSGSTA